MRAKVGIFDKLSGLLNYKKPLVPRQPDDWAAILFTSGSEGVPKGVVLSHRNILTNVAQARARLDFNSSDKVFNILPVFHSFGLTVGVILPIVCGVPIFLYPSPLHYRTVPELVYGINATIMFGTDTFLNGYARAANPYDFRSIRYLLAGAEPVRESTRMIYLEKFGLRILEGYGVTETAPALALNTPMFNKFGTVGRLLPGMEARLEKVEGVDEGGRLFVKGPNVMLGYLRVENPGVLERPPEGWHDTGDIVTIDAQGFIKIQGRAKRFAKVGGEMISFAAVEAIAGDLWPDAVSAVVAVPDARKGERLLLYTNNKNATRQEFMAFARTRHVSELMIPAEVIYMEKLPMLGSGKVDLVNLAKMAKEERARAGGRASAGAGLIGSAATRRRRALPLSARARFGGFAALFPLLERKQQLAQQPRELLLLLRAEPARDLAGAMRMLGHRAMRERRAALRQGDAGRAAVLRDPGDGRRNSASRRDRSGWSWRPTTACRLRKGRSAACRSHAPERCSDASRSNISQVMPKGSSHRSIASRRCADRRRMRPSVAR